jgi:radical SAM protein with 4Fe4S-binding SPASM domain
LYKRQVPAVFYTRKKLPKAEIQINSNGYLLTTEKYKKLVKAGVDKFLITQYKDKMPPEAKKTFEYIKNNKIENKIIYRVLGEDIKLSNRGGEIKINKGRAVDYDRPICAYPNTAVHIDYQGNVVLCCNDYHSSVIFGNLKNEKLINIWNKESYKRLRKELKEGIFKLPICKKCVGIKNK